MHGDIRHLFTLSIATFAVLASSSCAESAVTHGDLETFTANSSSPLAKDANAPTSPTGTSLENDAPLSDGDIMKAVQTNDPSRPRTFQETLDPYWRSLSLAGEPPEVVPVRIVTLEEKNEVYFECMAEQGFPSMVDQHGQQGIEFSRDQADALKLSQYLCYARYPLEDKYFEPYSVNQLRIIYDWNRIEVTECLRDQGVEASSPPSFEAFVERYALTGREHWTATEGLDVMSLEELCAQTPPDDLLYGAGE